LGYALWEPHLADYERLDRVSVTSMQTAFTIRRFEPADLARVMEINRTCLPENYSSSFFVSIFERFPETFVVAEEDGEVVGYAMCRVERRFGFGLFGGAKRGHLISIAVLSDFRRHGCSWRLGLVILVLLGSIESWVLRLSVG
jgi:ribosomal protein S18 acetylase RimI-like enzyme